MRDPVPQSSCQLCDFAATNDWVYIDGAWYVGPGPNMDQPGWLTIQLRRHAEGLQFLTEDELVSFGPIAAKVMVAIQDVMGAERVYMIQLGETFRHFHVLFAPRNADTPIEHRGAALFVNRGEYRNPARATAVAKSIRARLHN